MKSVKPGRGPSAMGVWGAVVVGIFGVFWTIIVVSAGAPAIFPVFGVLFVITALIMGLYNYKNATGKNRYSSFDITDDGEEPDPLDRRFGGRDEPRDDTRREFSGDPDSSGNTGGSGGYCPYCGAPADADYAFCRKCGKKLK